MNPGDLASFYLQLITNFLATPAGAAAILVLLAGTMLSITWPPMRWGLIAGAVYAATLPVNTVNDSFVYVPLAFPVEQLRLYSRPLTFACLGLLMLPLIVSQRGWRRRVVSWPLVLLFVFQIGISVRMAVLGGEARGPLSVLSFCLLFMTFGLGAGLWLQGFEDLTKLLWSMAAGGGLVVLTTAYQLAINRAPIMAGNRLAGMTGNPQFLGIILTLTILIASYLLVRPGGRKLVSAGLAVLVAMSLLMLIWTGSRTGALGTAIGVLVLFHRRLGRFLLFAPVVALAVYFLIPYYAGSTDLAARLISSTNTRGDVWAIMINDIHEHFWFGASRGNLTVRESSYLTMLAEVGLFGSLPFLAGACGVVYQMVQMQRIRWRLGPDSILIDLICAFWLSLGTMAMFEGFLLGVLVYAVLLVYLFSTLTTYVLDWARADTEQPLTAADPFAYPAAA